MTPARLQQTRPRQALSLLGGSTLLGVLLSYAYVLDLDREGGRSETTAAAVVLFVTALSCFAFGVLAGLLTRRLAPMLLGYLPGLVVVLLTGLQVADVPQQGVLRPAEVLADAWVVLNPLLWLPFLAVALALRTWQPSRDEPSPDGPGPEGRSPVEPEQHRPAGSRAARSPARTSGGSPRSTRSRTVR